MGAGDSYIAGFLNTHMDGADLIQCMQKGAENAAGAEDTENASELPAKEPDSEITMKEFLGRHKLFLVLTFGVFLLFYDHQIINFFMLHL